MNLIWIAGILSAIVLILQVFFKTFFSRIIKNPTTFILIFVGTMELVLIYFSVRQYYEWSVHAPGLLPPYTSFSYFIMYIATRLWAPYVVSALCGFVWWISMKFLNARYENKFFYPDEFLFAPLALFFVGYPGVLLYIVSFFALYILWSAGQTIWQRGLARVSMRYLWIPLALCVILIQQLYVSHLSWWVMLKI
ncbi:MAG: hypothetical protein M1320_02485 [Patescibacteria group bacterium]|nr:hypothetical protein [Patescibacteria group bacterium]